VTSGAPTTPSIACLLSELFKWPVCRPDTCVCSRPPAFLACPASRSQHYEAGPPHRLSLRRAQIADVVMAHSPAGPAEAVVRAIEVFREVRINFRERRVTSIPLNVPAGFASAASSPWRSHARPNCSWPVSPRPARPDDAESHHRPAGRTDVLAGHVDQVHHPRSGAGGQYCDRVIIIWRECVVEQGARPADFYQSQTGVNAQTSECDAAGSYQADRSDPGP
jgi:hypothetical protein